MHPPPLTDLAPEFIMTNAPVPYVFFAIPGRKAGLTEKRRMLIARNAADG